MKDATVAASKSPYSFLAVEWAMMRGGKNIAQDDALHSFGRSVVPSLAGLVIGAIVLVVAFVFVTGRRQDEEARVSSIRLAETAMATKKDNIARNLKDYSVWQDAFDNLHTKVDVQWAATEGNVGANIYKSLGYELAFVLSPDRRTVYAVQEGKPVEIDASP